MEDDGETEKRAFYPLPTAPAPEVKIHHPL